VGAAAESLSVGAPKLTIRIFFPLLSALSRRAAVARARAAGALTGMHVSGSCDIYLVRPDICQKSFPFPYERTVAAVDAKDTAVVLCVRRRGMGVARATPAATGELHVCAHARGMPATLHRRSCGALGPPALVHEAFFYVPLHNLFSGVTNSKHHKCAAELDPFLSSSRVDCSCSAGSGGWFPRKVTAPDRYGRSATVYATCAHVRHC
jgi:hypothetical protein